MFRLLEEYSDKRYGSELAVFIDILTNEELVLFLDEHEYYVVVSISRKDGSISCLNIKGFAYEVFHDGVYQFSYPMPSRTEATESGILKAFELLEHKLKQN